MRKLGLVSVFLILITLSITGLSQPSNLSEQANQAYRQKDYLTSGRLYRSAVDSGDRNPGNYYNGACAYSLAGKKDESFALLEELYGRGWANSGQLKKDTDFNALHTDPRWAQMVEKVTAKEARQKAFWDGPAIKTAFREDLDEDEKIAGLSRLWSETKFSFANFDLVPDVDWDRLYVEYLPKVRATHSTLEYYRVLSELVARLHDGHSNISYPRELVDRVFSRPAITTQLIEGRVIIHRVWDPKLGEAGLKQGQEIVEVNAMPVRQYAEKFVRPYQSASTAHDLDIRTYEYFLLAGPIDQPVTLTLLDASGRTSRLTVSRITPQERQKLTAETPAAEFRLLDGNIGYVTLNTFNTEKVFREFSELFDKIASTDGLILDIRTNGGGNSNNGYEILGYLTDKAFKTSKWRTRQYRPSYRAWGTLEEWYDGGVEEWQPNGTRIYTKPVAVLTGPRTYSAAEDFAVAFDFMKRGVIVGEPTGGSTGQPLAFSLPGGGNARICTKRDTYPDGREFVGIGIQPGIRVSQKLDDYRSGRDTQLEAAQKLLRSKIDSSGN